jgi:acyl-CoA synthetase (AMP-forming)/AMP-acid ligase II
MSLSEVLRLHARHRGTKPAIVEAGRTIDYGALDRIVDGLCWRFAEAGVRRGDLVGVGLRDHGRHLAVLYALARLGAVILPVDCRWSRAEQESVLRHFGASRVVLERDTAEPPPRALLLGDEWYEESGRAYRDPEVGPDTPLLLSLSSGTTGLPKGPRATHRMFESRFMVYWIDLGFTSQDRFISATPLYFGGGRGFSMAMLYAGATVDMFPPPYEAEALLDHVAETRGTVLFLVPTLLRRLLEAVPHEGVALPTLRRLVSSGSALHADERRAIRARLTPRLYELYASTEGGSVSMLPPGEFEAHSGSVGRPCFRVAVEIVDEAHRPLPPGDVGRLRYRSPASATSYYGAESGDAFRDGWFYPGDLAMFDAGGYLHLRGRAKDMIIRGGVNIYPGDIESVLLSAAGVADAAVVGAPSPELGEVVVAFVVRSGTDAAVDEASLRRLCRDRLAPYKVPERILFVDALPKSSLGKVLKRELIELAAVSR